MVWYAKRWLDCELDVQQERPLGCGLIVLMLFLSVVACSSMRWWPLASELVMQISAGNLSFSFSAQVNNSSSSSLPRHSGDQLRSKAATPSPRKEQPAQVLIRLPSNIDNGSSKSVATSSRLAKNSTGALTSTLTSAPSIRGSAIRDREYSTRTLSRKANPSSRDGSTSKSAVATAGLNLVGDRSFPTIQREIALGANRGWRNNWATTYGSDYNRYPSKI